MRSLHLHGVGRREREEGREREREEIPLALRATRPHTVGYIGECDQEEGVIDREAALVLFRVAAGERLRQTLAEQGLVSQNTLIEWFL